MKRYIIEIEPTCGDEYEGQLLDAQGRTRLFCPSDKINHLLTMFAREIIVMENEDEN